MHGSGARALQSMLPVLWLMAGCAGSRIPSAHDRSPFRFPGDTFAFANELVMEYEIDPVTRDLSSHSKEKPAEFALRCGAMARAARQFYSVARFDPSAPAADEETYTHLVREVLSTDPRDPPDVDPPLPPPDDELPDPPDEAELLELPDAGHWPWFDRPDLLDRLAEFLSAS